MGPRKARLVQHILHHTAATQMLLEDTQASSESSCLASLLFLPETFPFCYNIISLFYATNAPMHIDKTGPQKAILM